jgi:hypothetical protein
LFAGEEVAAVVDDAMTGPDSSWRAARMESSTAEPAVYCMHELVGSLDSEFESTVQEAAGKLTRLAMEADTAEKRHELMVSGAPIKLVQLVQAGTRVEEVVAALQVSTLSAAEPRRRNPSFLL